LKGYKPPIYTAGMSNPCVPCRLSVILKYVSPNSLTLSSSAEHWARESGSEINDEMVVKFLREIVLGVTQDLLQTVGRGGYIRDIVVHSRKGTIWAADWPTSGPPMVKF
jgi:hypothetical protein